MNENDLEFGKKVYQIIDILEDSETWNEETLKRCPALFLVVRDMWIQSKKKNN